MRQKAAQQLAIQMQRDGSLKINDEKLDAALRTPGFARSYDQAVKALDRYGAARQAQPPAASARTLPAREHQAPAISPCLQLITIPATL